MPRWVLLILLLAVLPNIPARALARQSGTCASYPAGPLPLAGYEQCVREAYVAARNADRIGLDEIAPRLTATREVQLDGAVLPVDNAWLADALGQEPPPYPLIEARLAALVDALGAERTPPPGDALARLDDVFERPPFQDRAVPSAWTQFWNAVGDAIVAFLDWIFGSLPSGGTGPLAAAPSAFRSLTPLGWALLLIGLLLVLALLAYAVRSVRRSVLRDARVKAQAAQAALSSGQALDRAQSEAQAGDYRGAVRFLYLGALLWLDEHKLLRYDRSLTNREYLDATRDDAPLHDRLAPVVGTFDRVVYGHRELSEEDFRAYQQQVDALRELERKT